MMDQGTPPSEYIEFRKQVKSVDGVLFVTPECNRSVPAVLKNALDVGSRPFKVFGEENQVRWSASQRG